MRYTITAPERDFTGEVAGVGFARGTATVDSDNPGARAALAYFGRKGYTVEPVEESKPELEPEGRAAPKRARRAGTKEEETEQ
jgi:hypothetical protein